MSCHLCYNIIQQVCEAISGCFLIFCPKLPRIVTLDCIVNQMRVANYEKKVINCIKVVLWSSLDPTGSAGNKREDWNNQNQWKLSGEGRKVSLTLILRVAWAWTVCPSILTWIPKCQKSHISSQTLGCRQNPIRLMSRAARPNRQSQVNWSPWNVGGMASWNRPLFMVCSMCSLVDLPVGELSGPCFFCWEWRGSPISHPN